MEQNQNPQPPEFDPQLQYSQPQYGEPQYQQPDYSVVGRPMMPFWTAVKTCFRKYFDFTGRARRSEYWWFILFYTIVLLIWIFLTSIIMALGLYHGDSNMYPLSGIFTSAGIMMVPILVFIIPQYAAQTRRLHDTGRSGWWVVASIVFSLAYLVTYCFSVLKPLIENGSKGFEGFLSSPMLIVVCLLGMISSILSIVILVFTILDGQRGENKYGPSPKYQ